MQWLPKDPDDARLYSVDWSEIYPDQIDTATFTVESGTVELEEVDPDPRMAFVIVSGGADEETATITHEIVTIGGQTLTRSITLLIGEGADSLSPVSDITKGALVTRALGDHLAIANYVFDLEAEEDVAALRTLDDMMAELEGTTNPTGYLYPATDGGSLPSDTAGIDRADVAHIAACLAVRIAPSYGKDPRAATKYLARSGWSFLLGKYRREALTVMTPRTPVGAGNRWLGRRYFAGR